MWCRISIATISCILPPSPLISNPKPVRKRFGLPRRLATTWIMSGSSPSSSSLSAMGAATVCWSTKLRPGFTIPVTGPRPPARFSQFEQHIRAITGLPLGDPKRHSDCVMENLIGDDIDTLDELAAEAGAVIHLYGKSEARPGRKMGHVTRDFPAKAQFLSGFRSETTLPELTANAQAATCRANR